MAEGFTYSGNFAKVLDTVNILVVVYKSTVRHAGIYACGHHVRLGDYKSLSGGG